MEGKNRLKRRRKRGEIFGLAKQNIFWRRKEKYSVVGDKKKRRRKIFGDILGRRSKWNNLNINSDWFGWPQSFKSKSIPSIARFWSWSFGEETRGGSASSSSSSSSKCAIQITNTKRSAHTDMEPARYSFITKNHVSSGHHVIHHAARVMWLCGAIHDRVTNDAEAASGFWTRVLQHSLKHSHLIAESLHRSTHPLLRCIFCHKLKTFEGE